MPVARIVDVDLYYELHGAGDPLVLIGGLGGDLSMLGGIIERLARTALVLAFDHRGSGRSSMSDTPGSIDAMAADAVGVMDAAGVAAAHLVGISMGGRIALAVALAYPERVRGLVLVSAGARRPAGLTTSLPPRIARRLRRLPPFRGSRPQPDAVQERQRAALGAYDCTARLGEIHVPALILRGRRDRTVPRRLVAELHDGLAGSKLVLFDGGHMFFMRLEREAFLRQVEAFLRAHRSDR